MARSSEQFVCQSCGAVAAKWSGRCDACGAWNSMVAEETQAAPPGSLGQVSRSGAARGKTVELEGLASTDAKEAPRLTTGLREFDRVCGGGVVPGSAILIGGEPGIGKSTVLLQASAALSNKGARVVYISGEEAPAQIRLRAKRLGLDQSAVLIASETNLRDVLATLKSAEPALVIADSIQTFWSDAAPSAPGSVTQVRSCAQDLIQFAKKNDAAMILVGHVTKEGQIAGPRVVEHMVDAVLYFESDPAQRFRILRAVKNRFGPAHEIGVFEMSEAGLREVENPSDLFLSERGEQSSGSSVFAGLEGTRPILVEFQALVNPSRLSSPRRAVVGWDSGRLAMLLAVLEARCGLALSGHDIYLNVAGGLRVNEPAADFAAAAALASAAADTPLPSEAVVFGEIGLSGAVRPVAQVEARIKEAERLGFSRALAPPLREGESFGFDVASFEKLADFIAWLGVSDTATPEAPNRAVAGG